MATIDLAAGNQDATHPDDQPRRAAARLLSALGCLLAGTAFLSLSLGATGLSFSALPAALAALAGSQNEADATAALVLFDIRLPRTLLALLVGASLAVAGAMMQGMFRNPLADPGLVGVSSGAALAAVSMIAFSGGILAPLQAALGVHAIPVAAFTGGLAVTALLVRLSSGRRELSTAGLLLAGLAIGAIAQALLGLISYLSDDRALRDLTLWTLGSFAGASWTKFFGLLPFAALAAVVLPRLTRGLDALLLGESEAFHLGIDPTRMKYLLVFVTAALVGSSVAVAGMIGFVGIVVPHLIRLIAGSGHAVLLPASALLGGALTLLADVIARIAVAPAELPVGIVMALIGAPFFLHLILNRKIHV